MSNTEIVKLLKLDYLMGSQYNTIGITIEISLLIESYEKENAIGRTIEIGLFDGNSHEK